MAQRYRRTIQSACFLSGVGLHSGEPCSVSVRPGEDGAGIIFRRKTAAGEKRIAASAANVAFADHGTSLSAGGESVATVEHLMAAFALAGIDDAIVDVEGPEAPILDGSAAPFLAAFERAGLRETKTARDFIQICEPIEVRDGDRLVRIEPASEFTLDVQIEFGGCLIGAQSMRWRASDGAALGAARTFCRLFEVDLLRQRGLIRGGSLENSIVVDGERILNPEQLRDPMEFVQHKALDLIGDLYLAGAPLIGAVTAIRPGHDLNTRLARLIETQAWAEGAAEPAAMAASA